MTGRSRRYAASLVAVLGLVAAGCSTTPGGGGTTPQAPVAAITAQPTSGVSPLTVDFGSTGSNDPDGSITSYSWNFGDGSPLASGPGATHTYTTPGNYTVTLVVTDNSNMTGSATTNINVVDPAAGCSAQPDPIDADGLDTNCDGVDGIAAAEILVDAASGSDLGACGTVAKPCATIANGIAMATGTGKSIVLVSVGSYDSFDVPSGLTVRGGYPTTFVGRGTTGTRVGGKYDAATNANYGVRIQNITSATKLADVKIDAGGSPGVVTTGISINNASAKVTLENVTATSGQGVNPTGVLVNNNSVVDILGSTINSGTATGAGSSAYGVRALNGSTVKVNGGSIAASAGVDGSNATAGAPATPGNQCNGGNGGNGQYGVLGSSPGLGGIACNPFFSGARTGGNGGNGQVNDKGLDGLKGGDTTNSGGAGGTGGTWNQVGIGLDDPTGGGGGFGGIAGVAGASGANNLANAGDLWAGGNGGNGGNGADGGGGGGGGGGKATWLTVGGGGGAGGSGGNAGLGATQGGTAGGGSFAVYAINSTATLVNVSTSVATGGNGGKGSAGGKGGNGGNGGNGGSESGGLAGPGAGGGAGAGGGGGAGAGGGAGGPSIAVFHKGTGTLTTTSVVSTVPELSGVGGAGGAGGAAGAGGSGGTGGGTGGGATAAQAGQTGAAGQAGQLLKIWDNGAATP